MKPFCTNLTFGKFSDSRLKKTHKKKPVDCSKYYSLNSQPLPAKRQKLLLGLNGGSFV